MNRIRIEKLTILLIVFYALVFSNESHAQKSKREEVYKNKLYKDYLDVHFNYDNDNKVASKMAVLYGQDLRYQQIVETVTIYSGSPKDLMKFMNDVEKFFSENEPEFSTTIEGRNMKIVKLAGMKGFFLYEMNGLGYRGYNMKTWNKIKDSLVQWAKENNESLAN